MKKVLSVIVLLIVALVVVTSSFTPAENVEVQRSHSTQIDFKDVGNPNVVPAYGPVNP